MNFFKKFYCRSFQMVFRVALPFLPYREPKILKTDEDVVEVLKKTSKKSVLLVTDKGIRGLGLTESLEKAVKNCGVKLSVYDEVVPNPTSDNVEAALQMFKENECDCLIAFGGGSVMDCAKATGARSVYPNKSLAKMKGVMKVLKKIPLLIAVPTTEERVVKQHLRLLLLTVKPDTSMQSIRFRLFQVMRFWMQSSQWGFRLT